MNNDEDLETCPHALERRARQIGDALDGHWSGRQGMHLATGLLLPIWDKLPGDYVRVSRIAANNGRSLLGREIGAADIPELAKTLGTELDQSIDITELASLVIRTGKAMPFRSVELLLLKRSLVNCHAGVQERSASARV